MKRKSNRPGRHELAPSEQTLPKYKLVKGEGRAWWGELDGVEFFLRAPDATPASPPCPVRDRERQLLEWLALARRYSTIPECVAAVQSLLREYRAQVAEFQRWHRRADLVREHWLRELHKHRSQIAKLQRRRQRVGPSPAPTLIKPGRGERDALDPMLLQWAGDVGRHILAQDDPVTALERMLGEKHKRGKRAKNKERDVSIAAAVASKMNNLTLEEAAVEVAREYRMGSDAVSKIYTRNKIEGRATRHKV